MNEVYICSSYFRKTDYAFNWNISTKLLIEQLNRTDFIINGNLYSTEYMNFITVNNDFDREFLEGIFKMSDYNISYE